MKLVFVAVFFMIIYLQSCEPCKDQIGKEEIYISSTRSFIDSILVLDNIVFQFKQTDNSLLYQTGWQHIQLDSLSVEVYIDGNPTLFKFDIQNDMRMDIYFSREDENICPDSLLSWENQKINNIYACHLYEKVDCP